jgi:hypothetical protein
MHLTGSNLKVQTIEYRLSIDRYGQLAYLQHMIVRFSSIWVWGLCCAGLNGARRNPR